MLKNKMKKGLKTALFSLMLTSAVVGVEMAEPQVLEAVALSFSGTTKDAQKEALKTLKKQLDKDFKQLQKDIHYKEIKSPKTNPNQRYEFILNAGNTFDQQIEELDKKIKEMNKNKDC